ncbi:hypothetical protein [Nocardia sp. AB354]|uniref:hypothetical protein n=1 Tax=Nocardia sp. AB354 TaxID=3413283 RepID=UPI003C1D59B9
MTDDDTSSDRVHIGGKTFETTRETRTTPEEMAEINAAFAAFEQARANVPEEKKFRLSDRFGGHDFDGTEYEEWVNQQRQKRNPD